VVDKLLEVAIAKVFDFAFKNYIKDASAKEFFAKVQQLIWVGEIEKARDNCIELIHLRPQSHEAYFLLASLQYKLEEFKKSITTLETALTIKTDPIYLELLGDALTASGSDKKAIEAYSKAIGNHPSPRQIEQKRNALQAKLAPPVKPTVIPAATPQPTSQKTQSPPPTPAPPAQSKPPKQEPSKATPPVSPPPAGQYASSSFVLDCGEGVTLDLVKIPAGKFMMGSDDGSSDEKPAHEVTLNRFWMGKFTVTQKQWQTIMGDNPSGFKGENLPVECVSWHSARAFCRKLSEKTGREVRLPTEAEWEYACRAGTTTPFYFGKTITTDQANYNGNHPFSSDDPYGDYREQTVDVDSFEPNAWGLYQMHGNVWEWCLDEWHDSYRKPDRLKQNGNEAWGKLDVAETDNRIRMLRGGSWYFNAWFCRSAFRSRWFADFRGSIDGFRVVAASDVR